jgi:anti-sigma factor RsiW
MLGLRRAPVCREMVELITDYIEGSLSRAQHRRFELHLDACENCAEYLNQMRATIRAAGRLREEDFTPEMSREFQGLYRRWQAEEKQRDW